jgi:hypothetical protein
VFSLTFRGDVGDIGVACNHSPNCSFSHEVDRRDPAGVPEAVT